MKKQILFVVESNNYLRNFVTTNILNELSKDFDLHFSINKGTSQFANEKVNKLSKTITYYSNPRWNFYNIIFDLTMWRKRKKSKTFRYRLNRTRGLNRQFLIKESFFFKTLRFNYRLARFFYHRIKYFLFANALTYPVVLFILDNISKPDKELINAVNSIKPDLILYPSSAFEATGIDLVKISKKKNIPSIFLIDNWDNLSSKSILWRKPNRVLVWGEQSKNHAISIQGFKPNCVDVIGSARFDNYFEKRNTNVVSNYNFKYILFVGTTLPFDESKVIYELDKIITANQKIFGKIKLVYRPHPWRQGKDKLKEDKLNNTIIDPQVRSNYLESNFSNTFQPKLEYYPSLIKNAEFVMGGLTSMIIEALIFKKRYLAIAYKEKSNLTSPDLIFKSYTHFQELENYHSVELIQDYEKLEQCFINFWHTRNVKDIINHENERNYLCYGDDIKNYGDRLKKICQMEMDRI